MDWKSMFYVLYYTEPKDLKTNIISIHCTLTLFFWRYEVITILRTLKRPKYISLGIWKLSHLSYDILSNNLPILTHYSIMKQSIQSCMPFVNKQFAPYLHEWVTSHWNKKRIFPMRYNILNGILRLYIGH